MSAYGQRRRGVEQRLVVKLDAWNIGELALLRECFPDTPWLFLYRDPWKSPSPICAVLACTWCRA